MKNFLAVFTGSKTSAAGKAWANMDPAQKKEREKSGMVAWTNWMKKNHTSLVFYGGPLSKTKLVDPKGVSDVSNQMSAFTVVKADSHEAAANMFVGHPHFSIFPGNKVEIMEVMPIPGQG